MSSIGRTPSAGRIDLSDVEEAEAASVAAKTGRDGKITTSELKSAEAAIARKYGPEKARAILVSALGVDPAKVDFKAVDYLQGKHGAMSGHIDRYQQVLAGHLKNAKILDANFDGKLDKNDLVFTKDAAGKVNVQKIGQALCDRVRIGAAMVDAAHAMAAAKHEFGGDLKANERLWKVGENPMATMKLQRGVKASEALKDIFANPGAYQFECATALVVLRYKAIMDLIGEKDFDRVCADLRIGPWDQENDAAKAWKVRGKAQDGSKIAASKADIESDLKPGDYTYFKNWSVSLSGWHGGWQGENVIFLGNDRYYGHPFGLTTGKEIVDYLNQHRTTRGTPKSASLMDVRASVDPSILRHDRNPG